MFLNGDTGKVWWRMSDNPDRITILTKNFTAAALEYHRGKMAERGYKMEGTITQRAFQLIEEEGDGCHTELFDGAELYAVTFVHKDAKN